MTRKELEPIFKSKQQKVGKNGKIIAGFVTATFEDFYDWFDQDAFDKGCLYCGTTNEQSLELHNLRLHAMRRGKRGRRLELDRMNPVLPYDNLQNIVWCCYWCNNAKSNFFKSDEFTEIALSIGKVLSRIRHN